MPLIDDTRRDTPPSCKREDETSETQKPMNTLKPEDPVSEQVDLVTEPVKLETEPVRPVEEPVADPVVLDSVVKSDSTVAETEEVLKPKTCSDGTKKNNKTMEDDSNHIQEDNSSTGEVRMSPIMTTREMAKDNDMIKTLTEVKPVQ